MTAGGEDTYKRFFHILPTMMARIGFDGRVVEANRSWEEQLGFSVAEMSGRPCLDLFHPEDRALVEDHKRRILGGENQVIFDARCNCKDGSVKWLSLRCASDPEKELIYLAASDITARKLTETALRESEVTLRAIIDSAPLAMSIVNIDGTIEYINQQAVKTFGFPHSDIPNMDRWWALAYPDETYRKEVVTTWMGRVYKAYEAKTAIEGSEFRVTCKDGSLKTCFIYGVIAAGKVFVMFDDVTRRVDAENALRRNEAMLRRILDQAPIGIAIQNFDNTLEFINKKFAQTFGYYIKDLPTLEHWARLAYPDEAYRKKLVAGQALNIEKALRTTGEMDPVEVHAVCKDGTVKTVLVTGIVTADKKIVSLLEDITLRKETEKALRESESRYRALVETTGTGYVIINKEGRVLDANREYVRLTGRKDLKEVLGRSVLDWTAPYEKEKNAAAVADCAAKGFIYNFEVDYAGPSGKIIPVEVNATVMQKDGVPQILTLCRDISERRNSEKRLLESEDKFRTLTEKSIVGVYLIQNEKFLYVNPALAKMGGYTPAEMTEGKGLRDLISPKDWEMVSGNVRKRISGETNAMSYEFTAIRKDGSEIEVEVYGSLTEYSGKPAIIGTLMDVTSRRLAREEIQKLNASLEQRVLERTAELTAANEELMAEIAQRVKAEKEKGKLREELEHSQKMEAVGRLAGGIAHDFNNILVSISGYAEFLLKTMPAGAPARDDLSEILLETEKGASLTRQLLTVSRKQPLQLKVVDLNTVAQEAEKMLKRLIGANMRLETRLDPALDRITADPGQLSQVIMNLVINARDAMPEGGSIILETRNAEIDREYLTMRLVPKPGHYVLLSVRDTGTGISPEGMQHIFEPFYTTKEPGKGTGLGLPTVYGIVSQAHGGIAVESEAGRGTTFKIYFPRTL